MLPLTFYQFGEASAPAGGAGDAGVAAATTGGYSRLRAREWFEREKQKVPRGTLRLPSKAQKIIEAVALRQVEKLETDELKHLEELTRELDLRGIEWETRYLEALNVRREALIDAEIAKLLKIKLEDEDALLLVMIAASI